jgi:DNA/RNA-binding domain of Phe-tRNA-synthetase-like protein
MSRFPSLCYHPSLNPRNVRVAFVWGLSLPDCAETATVPDFLFDILERVRASGEDHVSPARKQAVRGILRYGKFKPSGRSKPSSEYLLRAALEGNFPLVNGPVDVNNAISLEWGYPASIFDLDLCGTSLLLRRGTKGESYVFNSSGQTIDLEDLLCVCRMDRHVWIPCGNPAKDAMSTKITELTCNVVGVIYAPSSEQGEDLEKAAKRFFMLLRSDCKAVECGWAIPES